MESDESTMNEELKKWLKETRRDYQEQNKISSRKPTGLCSICGERKAEIFCIKCGRPVCSSCSFSLIGVCKECVPKEIAEKWEGKRPDWEKLLGVEWVE